MQGESVFAVGAQAVTGLLFVQDTSSGVSDPSVVCRLGSDGVWRPTRGHGVRDMRRALAAVGFDPAEGRSLLPDWCRS